MSYREALEATNAKVIDYAEFGSYQGDWFAIIELNGTKSVIQGSFGSCSSCDAFQGEFDYSDPTPEKLKAFGERLLISDSMTIDEAIKYANKHIEWDAEAVDMVNWLNRLKITEFNDKLEKIIKGE